MFRMPLLLASLLVSRPAWTQSPATHHAVAAWAERNSSAHDYLRQLCDGIGSRLTGSPQDRAARAWAVDKLRKLGLKNVREQMWTIPSGWTRHTAQAEIRSPGRHIVSVTSLGWSGSTRRGGVEAAVVAVNRNALAQEAGQAAKWRGKILFLTSKGEAGDPLDALKAMEPFLRDAVRAGAVAVIDGDASASSAWNLARVDLAALGGGEVAVPVLRMAADHRAILERLLDSGQSVRLWIDVRNRFQKGPVPTANVVADIPGAELPAEIVLLGAHLDSWDLGQGAADDGFGVAAVLGAAEAIIASGARPRRTIRVALFNGEEQGIHGSRAYIKEYRAELSRHIAALIADMGDGVPAGWMLNGRSDLVPLLRDFAVTPVAGRKLQITDAPFLLGDSMAFTLAGLPALDLLQQSADFQRRRHTHADTFEKVPRQNLIQAAAILAATAVWIADRAAPLSPRRTAAEVNALTRKLSASGFLELLNLAPSAP